MEEIGEIGLWAVRIGTILLIAIIFLIIMERLRVRYAKFVVGKVQCRFITPERNTVVDWIRVIGGTVALPKTKKYPKGREYAIADIGCYEVDYPDGWCPKFIRARAKEALFDIESYEPLSNNTGRPIMSAALLYNRLREKDTSEAMENARRESLEGQGMPSNRLTLVYVGLAITVLCGGVVTYLSINYLPPIMEGIQKLAAAAGV